MRAGGLAVHPGLALHHRHGETIHRNSRAMQAMSTGTLSVPVNDCLSVSLPSGVISVGYNWHTTGATNFSVYLMPETEFNNFFTGLSFMHYPQISRTKTAAVWLPTVVMTSSTAVAKRYVLVGSNFAAVTLEGMTHISLGACLATPSCQNGGLCEVANDGSAICDCMPGWSGTDCTTPVCSVVTCNSHQSCTGPDICTCTSGWAGITCQTPTCSPICVPGQGACTAPNTCTCSFGFSGSTCSLVNGGYTAFGSYGACTPVSSNDAAGCTQTRTRTCTNPTPVGGSDCSGLGAASQTISCSCAPVNGGMSAWSDTGSCALATGTLTCFQSQVRTCTNPIPRFGGAACTGTFSQSVSCACGPLNGGYGAWNFTSECSYSSISSATCTRNRVRECNSPTPQFGGLSCTAQNLGASIESVACVCPPRDGGYTAYGKWSICAGRPICSQSRARACTNPEPGNGGRSCLQLYGAATESRVCTTCEASGAPLTSSSASSTSEDYLSTYDISGSGSGASTFSTAWSSPATWIIVSVISLVLNVIFGFLYIWYAQTQKRKTWPNQQRGGQQFYQQQSQQTGPSIAAGGDVRIFMPPVGLQSSPLEAH